MSLLSTVITPPEFEIARKQREIDLKDQAIAVERANREAIELIYGQLLSDFCTLEEELIDERVIIKDKSEQFLREKHKLNIQIRELNNELASLRRMNVATPRF